MQCWFWNIASDRQEYFKQELDNGRLRQGWGYDDALDLRKIKEKISEGQELDKKEQITWDRCRFMLESIAKGDLIVVKNIPKRNNFSIVKVEGSYQFNRGEIGDFGHFLPINGAEVKAYHKNSKFVPAPFVNALNREQYPIRRTKKHRETVVQLFSEIKASEEDTLKPQEQKEKIENWKLEISDFLKNKLYENLNSKDAEKFIQLFLQWDGDDNRDVEDISGPKEEGADLILKEKIGYGIESAIGVQVKMHWGTDNSIDGISQLKRAIDAHDVQAGLLITFANEIGPDLKKEIEDAQKEYNIEVFYGNELFLRLLEMTIDPEYGVSF